jgi:hypothetical protein
MDATAKARLLAVEVLLAGRSRQARRLSADRLEAGDADRSGARPDEALQAIYDATTREIGTRASGTRTSGGIAA